MTKVISPRFHFLLIIVGVSMTIISVIFMHVITSKYDQEIETRQLDVANVLQRIDGLWNEALRFESGSNTALVMWYAEKDESAVLYYLEQALNYTLPEGKAFNPKVLMDMQRAKRFEALEVINNIYLKRITLENDIAAYKYKKERAMLIGLFLHILGVMAILILDITTRRRALGKRT